MAAEALQILNLSPIPELSEMELSNVLEQFSGLSELTGELTDRNVEDIIREAEELLDMSSSVKEISEEIAQDDSDQASENDEVKENNSSLENKTEESNDKDLNSEEPELLLSARLKSPGDSKNHIKSTIDSLKEYSKIIEDHINSKTDEKKEEKKQVPESSVNRNVKEPLKPEKPIKIMAAKLTSPVQRLTKNYSVPGKLKHVERITKASIVRKTFNDFKSKSNNSTVLKNKVVTQQKKDSPGSSRMFQPTVKTSPPKERNNFYHNESNLELEKCIALLDEETSPKKINFKYPQLADHLLKHSKESICTLQKEVADLKAQLMKDKARDRSKLNSELDQKFFAQEDLISSLKEENAKLFREIKEIKGQIKINVPDQNVEKAIKEEQSVIETLRSEIESLRNCIVSKPNSSPGLSRLEEQFEVIKDKYNQQIEKLELENKELKDALLYRKKEDEDSKPETENKFAKEIAVQTEKSPVLTSTRLIRSTSFENWRKPRLWENVRSAETNGDAICQTDREKSNASVQSDECPRNDKRILETRKVDNKENIAADAKKSTRAHNFNNLDQIMTLVKQKKAATEHENHLMATLKGLRADVLFKDKENKKLKIELESLKNQLKKITVNGAKKKVEPRKKIHAGTQTIGLGPCVQATYDPALFQVSKELQNENEELKGKIKSLEEQCVQLKNKRASDLQILQDIHEQEMAKLESKLESQTALAKHLHTLLLNR